jgi:SAM-dependent methyltransferase
VAQPEVPAVIVTGERVVTRAGGFGPTWQRHVAAYALCAQFLPAGRIVDLGCGVGHSFGLLAPRETVGVDIAAEALAGQDRETVVADMRALPFADGSFDGLISVQSLEHVADGGAVVREARRVVRAGGVAVFHTPNRLTFARPDEIVDPYHFVEYDPEQLRALCETAFARVELHGVFGSPRYAELWAAQLRTLDRVLALDPLRLRRFVPRRARQFLYDLLLTFFRRRETPAEAAIGAEDFRLEADGLDAALDVVAVCR